jgi:tetratricopeptide (TPR) repeat protein
MSQIVGGDSSRRFVASIRLRDRRPESPPTVLLMAALLVCLLAPAAAEDTVYLTGSAGGQTKISGRVLDYTGRELKLEHAAGREQSFPAEKVERVETQYGRQQTDADALFAKNQFDQALGLYIKAVESEPRRWVRRQIIAQIVYCYRALDRPERAGEAFLLLIRDDPDTLYFDCIPLAWAPRQPPADLELAARRWLERPEPAAQLLGASHLLAGRDRPTALRHLQRLSAGAERPAIQEGISMTSRWLAGLALAQTWRAEVATATPQQIDGWSRLIEQMPEPLAAGPYLVLGRARAQCQQPAQAALALLRVAILYPQHRELAAQSLVDAGRELQKLGRSPEALRLYREAVRSYPEQTRPVAEAQSRLEEIGKRQPPSSLTPIEHSATGDESSKAER